MADTQRIDKWLWYARFYRSRSLVAKQITAGKVSVNDAKITKPSQGLELGDILTFVKADRARVIKVLQFGTRRGSAPEAQKLYDDRSPRPTRKKFIPPNPKFEGKGRPNRQDRRQTAAFVAKHLD